MSERFKQLYKLPNNLYMSASPIIISAGALLEDTQTGKLLVQLKFKSISDKIIKAVKLNVSVYDVSNTKLSDVDEYQYLDLSIREGQFFGENKAIIVSENIARSFEINKITVVFDDNTSWTSNDFNKFNSITKQQLLTEIIDNDEIVKQYQFETNSKSFYIPIVYEDLWLCTCGEYNKSNVCCNCGIDKDSVFIKYDIPMLTEQMENRLSKEKTEKEKKKQQVVKKQNKIKKLMAIIVTVVIVCLMGYFILNDVIIPIKQYKQGVELYNLGKYFEAIEIFSELGDYKDATEQIDLCNERIREKNEIIREKDYNKAVDLYMAGKRFEAARYFISLDGYKDSMYYLQKWNAKTIVAGGDHTLAITNNGKVLSTINTSNICITPKYDTENLNEIISVSEGHYHANVLKKDGTVVYLGNYPNSYYNRVSNWNNIVSVFAGKDYTIGLKSNGTVISVGPSSMGEDSAIDVEEWEDIVSISTGSTFEASVTIGLKADGTVVATGDNNCGQCNVSGWENIVAVSASPFHTVGLKGDGTVVATVPLGGYAQKGQCDVQEWENIIAISSGSDHTVGLQSDGTVIATGGNYFGQCDVLDWTNIVAISAGDFYTIGLKSDGTLLTAGRKSSGECNVDDWKDIRLPD